MSKININGSHQWFSIVLLLLCLVSCEPEEFGGNVGKFVNSYNEASNSCSG